MPPRRAVLFDIGDTLVHRPTVGPARRIAEALGLSHEQGRTIGSWIFREPFASPAALAARLREAFDLRSASGSSSASPAADAPNTRGAVSVPHMADASDAIEAAVTAIWEAQQSEPVELEGATACVAAARERGARVAVVSNIWAPYEAGFRRACPAIVPLVESWHMSYRAGIAKPDLALFRAALHALDVAPEDAVMIGDNLDKDVRPALALGMRAIWIPAGEGAEGASDLLATAADAVPDAIVVRDLHGARARLLALLDAPV
jgi:putative hydrolase of the HAD superfamily